MTWWDGVLRWRQNHRFGLDVTATAFMLLVGVPTSVGFQAVPDPRSGADVVVAVLLIAPLAWRRVRPAASAAVVYSVALLQLVFVTPLLVPADLAVLVSLYSVTVHGPRWAHRVAIVGALVGGALLPAALGGMSETTPALAAVFFVWAVALAVWASGLARRSRQETLAALVDRADRFERERDQHAQIATAAERARIAREMHDIVAHSLTVMIAQADGGRYAADADPSAATRALGTIAETGRAALTDMRRLLGVLRAGPAARTGAVGLVPDPASGAAPSSTSGPGGDPAQAVAGAEPAFTPQPAVEDVPALVEQVRASGLRVSFVRMGNQRHLPPGVGLTAYRIAQEALTNVLKHAGPDPRVTVVLSWRPQDLLLEISDDGRGAAADSDGLGQGLLGMRERATMFGGSISTGPRPGGGYRVRAVLPTGPASSTTTVPPRAEPSSPPSTGPTRQDDR